MRTTQRVAITAVKKTHHMAEMCKPWFEVQGELNERERVVCFVGWLHRRRFPFRQAVEDGSIVIHSRGDYLNWLFAIGQYILGQIAAPVR